MILTFATTSNLLDKNKARHEAFENITEPWNFDQDFFKEHNAMRPLDQDIGNLT
jgi:hypothetical protein